MSSATFTSAILLIFLLLAVQAAGQTASNLDDDSALKPLRMNRTYLCGGERLTATECGADGKCKVLRAGGTANNAESVEPRADLVKTIQSCLLEKTVNPQNATPERPTVFDAYLVSGNIHYAAASRHLAAKEQGLAAAEFAKAAEDYNKALAANPRLFEAYSGLGLVYQKQGDFRRAAAAWSKALETRPNSIFALNQLGIAQLFLEQFPDSVSAFSRAIKLKSDFAVGYYNLGLTYASMGKEDDAMKVYETLMSIDKAQAQRLMDAIGEKP